MLLRVDENDFTDRVNQDDLKQIKNNFYKGFKFDGLIISDYCKGFLTEEDIDFLIHNNHHIFLDTKKILGEWMYDIDFVKINEKEYEKTGDTFLSGFAYEYMKTKDVKSAIDYAQECATIVVQKHGVATI